MKNQLSHFDTSRKTYNNGAMTIIRQRPPLKNACGPSCLRVFLQKRKRKTSLTSDNQQGELDTYLMQSPTPLKLISPSAFFSACSRVLITSNGLTARAAKEPEAQPLKKEM
jgi:hypothetical protein